MTPLFSQGGRRITNISTSRLQTSKSTQVRRLNAKVNPEEGASLRPTQIEADTAKIAQKEFSKADLPTNKPSSEAIHQIHAQLREYDKKIDKYLTSGKFQAFTKIHDLIEKREAVIEQFKKDYPTVYTSHRTLSEKDRKSIEMLKLANDSFKSTNSNLKDPENQKIMENKKILTSLLAHVASGQELTEEHNLALQDIFKDVLGNNKVSLKKYEKTLEDLKSELPSESTQVSKASTSKVEVETVSKSEARNANEEELKNTIVELEKTIDKIDKLKNPTPQDLEMRKICQEFKDEALKAQSENKKTDRNEVGFKEVLKKQIDKWNPTTSAGKAAFLGLVVLFVAGTITDKVFEYILEETFGNLDDPEILREIEDSIHAPLENMNTHLEQLQSIKYQLSGELLAEKKEIEQKAAELLRGIKTIRGSIANTDEKGASRNTEQKIKSGIRIRNLNKTKYKEDYNDYFDIGNLPKSIALNLNVANIKPPHIKKIVALFGGILLAKHELLKETVELNQNIVTFNEKVQAEGRTFGNTRTNSKE